MNALGKHGILRSALVALLCAPGVARAGAPSLLAEYDPAAPSTTLELEVGGSSSAGAKVLEGVLGARHALTRSVQLELQWPLMLLDASLGSASPRDDGFNAGNPWLALYDVDRGPDGYVRVGVGIAPPLNTFADDPGLGTAVGPDYAAAVRGFWDSWLYAPEDLGIVIPLQLEHRGSVAVYGLELVLAALRPGTSVATFSLQFAPMAGARLGDVSLGARLQTVWLPFFDDDNAFVSLVPFVQAELSESAFAYARFVLNLDEPLGVFGDGAKIWGAFASGGGRF